jgi:colanic acid/amylovoran biosynthesis glycosyltransferase
LRTVAHTWLGAYFAVILKRDRISHVHVHHGYFASWIGMTAARLLDINFSLTLHGSDLLLRADYLDAKLKNCQTCFTISEFNRRYILDRYPEIEPDRVVVQHLGIDPNAWKPIPGRRAEDDIFRIFTVGRLHLVKNHAFLILACRALKSAGLRVDCRIAGEGEEKYRLKKLIAELDLHNEVELLGQVPRSQLPILYSAANVVVLTSHSEGIPLTLMEAMAMERVVLAPAITGIPELVSHGKTGFLYRPESMEDFLAQLQIIFQRGDSLTAIGLAARRHALEHFNSDINLQNFADTFLMHAQLQRESQNIAVRPQAHEDSLLQQI